MFAHGVHYGHRSCFSNPEMADYVYAKKNDMQIIDITQTAVMFTEALNFLEPVIRSGGRIVIVGTKMAARDLVNQYGKEMEMPYVDQRWLGGTLTNFKTVRASVARLDRLEKQFQEGNLDGLTKKERLILQRERAKLTVSLGGIKDLDSLPEVLFVIDVAQERIAIKEANKLGIPVIGVVDTNCSPEGVDYVIPGNDDALSAIQYYLECLSAVVKVAHADFKKEREKLEKKNKPVVRKTSVKAEKAVKVEATEESVVDDTVKKKVVKKVVKKKTVNTQDDSKEEAPAKKVVMKVKNSEEKPVEASVKKPAAKKPAAKKPAAKKPAAKKPAAEAVKKPAAKKPAAKKTADAKETKAKSSSKKATKE